jgi:hypothetical protein
MFIGDQPCRDPRSRPSRRGTGAARTTNFPQPLGSDARTIVVAPALARSCLSKRLGADRAAAAAMP